MDEKYKGKYYKNGILEFDGEFKNNKKWNGFGYDKKGKITYQLINGNGIIKEYDDDGYLKYEGEYLNGLRNGKGKVYYQGKLIFECEYLIGKKMEKEKNMMMMVN